MRALPVLAAIVLTACGPKVDPKAPAFDDDLSGTSARAELPAQALPTPPAAPAEAPPGKGLRAGTIDRARLVAVLDAGPGAFLRQFEVAAAMNGDRFVGWQLVQLLDRTGPLVDLDVVPGDVLLVVNGKSLARPDELQAMWDSLRTANQLVAELSRGTSRVKLAFEIEPKISAATK